MKIKTQHPQPIRTVFNRLFPINGAMFLLLMVLLIIQGVQPLYSQPTPFPPPREIRVYTAQDISFGSFYTGPSGGTVVMSPTGMRTSTGSVILAGGFTQQAIFIVELLPGRLVTIMFDPLITLNRIGGGGTMTMSLGPTDKGSSFVTSGGHPFRNPVQVGGTLNVGNIGMNPAGSYEGYFNITFIQE